MSIVKLPFKNLLLCFMYTRLVYVVRFGLIGKVKKNRYVIIDKKLSIDSGKKEGTVFGTADHEGESGKGRLLPWPIWV